MTTSGIGSDYIDSKILSVIAQTEDARLLIEVGDQGSAIVSGNISGKSRLNGEQGVTLVLIVALHQLKYCQPSVKQITRDY